MLNFIFSISILNFNFIKTFNDKQLSLGTTALWDRFYKILQSIVVQLLSAELHVYDVLILVFLEQPTIPQTLFWKYIEANAVCIVFILGNSIHLQNSVTSHLLTVSR